MRNNTLLRLATVTFVFVCLAEPFFTTRAYAQHKGETVVVSLGDSYSSGEGCEKFYGQDSPDRRQGEGADFLDWVAHRSEGSWPGQLTIDGEEIREGKGKTWFFYASSGAVTRNIYAKGANAAQDKTIDYWEDAELKTRTVHLLGQLEYTTKHLDISGINPAEVDYVTLTIGGNDIGFTDIVMKARVGAGTIDSSWLANSLDKALASIHDHVKEDLEKTYIALRDTFPNAHIIVAGYPTLMDDHDILTRNLKEFEHLMKAVESGGFTGVSPFFTLCSFFNLLSSDSLLNYDTFESLLVNCKVSQFNKLVEETVRGCGVDDITFVPVEDKFRGHEAETQEPFLNGVILGSEQEDLQYL